MKSIVTTYPDFQALPKGIKRMLVISETNFFEEAKPVAGMALVSKSVHRSWTPLDLFDHQAEAGGNGFSETNVHEPGLQARQ